MWSHYRTPKHNNQRIINQMEESNGDPNSGVISLHVRNKGIGMCGNMVT
jgi:hypothetical protein